MRRIDLHLLSADKEWDKLASDAASKVKKGAAISAHSDVWRATKERLKKVSHGKCWYCESRQSRSDNAVDHFRPKSHYPWLAFVLSNYRYACTFCNSVRRDGETGDTGGKGDHFPLFNPPRALNASGLRQEGHVLLDPCLSSDVGLLDFRDDGSVCARYPKHKKRSTRAEQSIGYYHLNHTELEEARRKLALKIKEWIMLADEQFNAIGEGDIRAEHAFEGFSESLCKALSEQSEFTAFARRIVDGYRNLAWIEDLLRCA